MSEDNILPNSISPSEALVQQIMRIHGGFTKFIEADFFPEHEKRHETEEYRQIHHKIIKVDNAPCVVCGVTTRTLDDPSHNFYKATQIELHHFHIEWALTNAIDIKKFNNLFRPHLKYIHSTEKLYQEDLTVEQIKNWIDHHPHNLMPLCNVHHRHKYWGIHHVSYPNWGPTNLFQQEFINQMLNRLS